MNRNTKKRPWAWLLAAPLLAMPVWAAAAFLWSRWGVWLSEAVTAAVKVVLIP